MFPAEIIENIISFLPLECLWDIRLINKTAFAIVMRRNDFREYKKVVIMARYLRGAIDAKLAEIITLTLMYDIKIPRFLPFRAPTSEQIAFANTLIAPRKLPQPLVYLYTAMGGQDCVVENVPYFRIRMTGGKNILARMISIKFLVNEMLERPAIKTVPFAEVCDNSMNGTFLVMCNNGYIYLETVMAQLIPLIDDDNKSPSLKPLLLLLDESATDRQLI